MGKATEKDMEELLLVTADAAESRGFAVFAEFLRDLAADDRGMKIPDVVAKQWLELHYRAIHSITDHDLREQILEAIPVDDDYGIDYDALINDNEESGYWVTGRFFVYHFDEDDEEPDDIDG